MGHEFVWTFPVYAIVHTSTTGAIALIGRNLRDDTAAIAIYTEELLAERARDRWIADAKIVTLPDMESLTGFVSAFYRTGGFTRISIDHDTHATARWMRIFEY